MTVLLEKIQVDRKINEAFEYVANFATTQEWDSTVIAAVQTTDGPIQVGSRFDVRCAMPIGWIDLTYEITELDRNKLIVLRGKSRFFEIEDRITFRDLAIDGCQIEYRAEFFFKPLLAQIAHRFDSGLHKMGGESVAGLKAALEDSNPPPSLSKTEKLGNTLVLPGVARFSKVGYSISKKHWRPLSTSITGKHMVVTGATTGLGYSTALNLARRGAKLTLVVRDAERGAEAVDQIRALSGNNDVSLQLADLAVLTEVDALIERLIEQGEPIDVLVNNAGALFNERQETVEGIERSLALLLLSPYRLMLGLQPLLKQAKKARVINVVSGGLYSQKLSLDKLLETKGGDYAGAAAYSQAKRALLVATQELGPSWQAQGITITAMHPGWADTPGVETALPGFHSLMELFLRSPAEGADTIVWLAVAQEAGEMPGELFLDRKPQPAHLLRRTQEDVSERTRLMTLLHNFLPGEALPKLEPLRSNYS